MGPDYRILVYFLFSGRICCDLTKYPGGAYQGIWVKFHCDKNYPVAEFKYQMYDQMISIDIK